MHPLAQQPVVPGIDLPRRALSLLTGFTLGFDGPPGGGILIDLDQGAVTLPPGQTLAQLFRAVLLVAVYVLSGVSLTDRPEENNSLDKEGTDAKVIPLMQRSRWHSSSA